MSEEAREERKPDLRPEDLPDDLAPEDLPDRPGAEGGSKSAAADALAGSPSDDDTPLGDTDQHSSG